MWRSSGSGSYRLAGMTSTSALLRASMSCGFRAAIKTLASLLERYAFTDSANGAKADICAGCLIRIKYRGVLVACARFCVAASDMLDLLRRIPESGLWNRNPEISGDGALC